MKKMISIYVPCYNEENNVRPMAETLSQIMKLLNYEYEIVFRDNDSQDLTRQYLHELAAQDSHIKVIVHNRNYGAGGRGRRKQFQCLSGDAVIVIACDFQEPPELIPEFIKYWEEGYKVVGGQKIASKEGKLKFFLRDMFYRIINVFSEVPQYAHMSGISLYDREVIDALMAIDEDIVLRNAIADMGYEVKLIQYVQEKRRSGKSSYNIWSSLAFAINSLVNTSTAPLRLMTIMGFCMSLCSFLLGVFYMVMKLTVWYKYPIGIAPILLGVLFLGSIQLFCMGMLGEYIGAIFRKVSKQPEVIFKEKINFDEKSEIK